MLLILCILNQKLSWKWQTLEWQLTATFLKVVCCLYAVGESCLIRWVLNFKFSIKCRCWKWKCCIEKILMKMIWCTSALKSLYCLSIQLVSHFNVFTKRFFSISMFVISLHASISACSRSLFFHASQYFYEIFGI